MGLSRYPELAPADAATKFAEDCERNVEAFAGGLNGRARGEVHDMELTDIAGGLFRIYLPACHTATFGMNPLAFEATPDGVSCKNCQCRPVTGRSAPRIAPTHHHTRNWRSRAQLALAYPDDPEGRRSGLWRV